MHAPKITALDIEVAVADYFGVRANVIVPNVSWGFFSDGHEADVVVLRASGWAEEVEIKVSAADIRRDLRKSAGRGRGPGHARPATMSKLWFAVPEALARDPNIPADAGVLAYAGDGRVVLVRGSKKTPGSRKLTDAEQLRLLRLLGFRVWSLKQARDRDLRNIRYRDDRSRDWGELSLRWDGARNGIGHDYGRHCAPYPS